MKKNGKCLSIVYVNNYTNLLWECSNGHRWMAMYRDIYQDRWCPHCYELNHFNTIEDCAKLAERNSGKCLSTEYTNNKKYLLWECKNGHQWKCSYDNIFRGSWCPQCNTGLKTQNKLFEIVKNLFRDKQCFSNFKDFDWLKTKKRGKQEIDVFVKDLKLAIEYDGVQHFKPVKFWGGEKELSQIQQRDQLKNKLIAEHPDDVKYFIRIPYTVKITEDNIKNILIQNGVLK